MNKFKVGDIVYWWGKWKDLYKTYFGSIYMIENGYHLIQTGVGKSTRESGWFKESDLYATPEECLLNKPT